MKWAAAGLILLFVASFVPAAAEAGPSGAGHVQSTILSVFSDGTAEVNQTVSLTNMSSITIPLLSTQVGNILAVSDKGNAVPYEISNGNMTLSTFGISRVTLVYDTDGLTSKQGSVWDLRVSSPYNMILVLPYQSTVLSLSRAAGSYSTAGGNPTLSLSSGAWEVSYGLALSVPSSTTFTSSTGTGAQGATSAASWQLPWLAVVAGAVVASGVAVYAYRSRSGRDGMELRPDDKKILDFVREHGGVVTEVEIREMFSLPRTSAWRQAKRLEKLGLVKITKVGKQNRVELVLAKSPSEM